MVFTTIIKDNVRSATLSEFDPYTHIAFGTGTTIPNDTDTTLSSEVERKATDEKIKNTASGTYDFSAVLGLTEANGNDISEVGILDSSSGGDMSVRELLNNIVSKTSSVELSVGIRVKVEVN